MGGYNPHLGDKDMKVKPPKGHSIQMLKELWPTIQQKEYSFGLLIQQQWERKEKEIIMAKKDEVVFP